MSLLSLPNELLDHVFSYLDLSSSLTMSSVCTRMKDILISPWGFKTLLMKIKEDDIKTVELLIEFLVIVPARQFMVDQLSLKIMQGFSGIERNRILITWSTLQQINFTMEGFLLLTKMARRWNQPLPVVSKVEYFWFQVSTSCPGLLALASCIQEQEQEVEMLVAHTITCRTEEEGLALVCLLASCTTWSPHMSLELSGEVGSVTWGELAKLMEGRRLFSVHTTKEVMTRGRREDIMKVWQSVCMLWEVQGEMVVFNGDEKGWRRIEQLVDQEQSPSHSWFELLLHGTRCFGL